MGRTRRVDRLEAPEGPLDTTQALVGAHHVLAREPLGRDRGAQHVDAVERGLLLDGVLPAGHHQVIIGDVEIEVLGHLEAVDDPAHRQTDAVGATESAGLDADDDGCEPGAGGSEQVFSLPRPLVGGQGVPTHHQALTGVLGDW